MRQTESVSRSEVGTSQFEGVMVDNVPGSAVSGERLAEMSRLVGSEREACMGAVLTKSRTDGDDADDVDDGSDDVDDGRSLITSSVNTSGDIFL